MSRTSPRFLFIGCMGVYLFMYAPLQLINTFLTEGNLIDAPLPLLHNQYSVVVGLVYTYLPFMILPLYAALDRLDRSVLEAAADLGATARERFFKVTVPLTKGGMLSGSENCNRPRSRWESWSITVF